MKSRKEIEAEFAEVSAILARIHELEYKIEDRLWQGSKPVLDIKTGALLSEENINLRANALADEIAADPNFKDFILICILDGGLPFFNAMQQALKARSVRFQYATIQAKSYIGMVSGELSVTESKIPVAGKNVLFLDDVWDTGKTLAAVNKKCELQGAREIRNVVAVNKDQPRISMTTKECKTYVGFTVSSEAFIIGYGLDYNGMLRNETSIRAVDLKDLPNVEEQSLLDLKSTLIIEYQNLQKELAQLESTESKEFSPNPHSDRFFAETNDLSLEKETIDLTLEAVKIETTLS